MQRFTIMLAAAVALIFSQAPQLAWAAAAPAKPAPPPTRAQIDRGMKEAPPLAAASGVPCTISSAAFLGAASQNGANGKPVQLNVYELACNEGLGYVLMSDKTQPKPQVYDCLAIKSSGSMTCLLPVNAKPEQGLQRFVTSIGAACTINNARYMGSNAAAGINVYEIGCEQGAGYVLNAPSVGSSIKPTLMSCLKAESGSLDCQFTPKAQRISHVAAIAAAAPNAKDCTVARARWVTSDPSKATDYYELGCDAGKPGFMIEVSANDSLVRALSCAQAASIAGGCNFTDVNTALSSDNATYTRLANAAGLPCTVDKYRLLGVDTATNSEVVELSCSNRPAGAVAFFPVNAGKARIYDCIRSTTRGLTCRLSTADKVYPNLTADLKKLGKTTCTVSNARAIGIAQQSEFVETACSDGLPGFIIEYDINATAPKAVINCSQGANIGGGCKLPTNASRAAAAPAAPSAPAAGARR